MYAIEVKRLEEIARLEATTSRGSITLPFNYVLSIEENELTAALALVKKMGWDSGKHPLTVSLKHSGRLKRYGRSVFTLHERDVETPVIATNSGPSFVNVLMGNTPEQLAKKAVEHPDYLKPLVDCDALDWGEEGE